MQNNPEIIHRDKQTGSDDHIPAHDEPHVFGDMITPDHEIILNKVFPSFDKGCDCLAVRNIATYFLGLYPSDSEDANSIAQGFDLFIGPNGKVKPMYSDD